MPSPDMLPAPAASGLPVATVILKPKRARPFFGRHPWVLDAAVARVEGSPADGDVVDLATHEGRFVARGLWNSASRLRVAAPGISRSTTTSIRCLSVFSSAGGSSTRQIRPSTRARVNPWRTRSANRSRCSPLASRTSGARIVTRAPLRAARIRSTIWSRGWASSTLSHSGQWAVPTRAKRTRRKSWISVIVATVDRGFVPADFCAIEIAGDRPVTLSTSGRGSWPRNCRANVDRLSTYRRCPSA